MTEPLDFKQLEIDGLSFGNGHVTLAGAGMEEEHDDALNFIDAYEKFVAEEVAKIDDFRTIDGSLGKRITDKAWSELIAEGTLGLESQEIANPTMGLSDPTKALGERGSGERQV